MESSKDEGPAQCSKGIGQPIPKVVPASIFKKRLMIFVPNSNQGERECHHESEASPRGGFFEKERGGKESTSAKKVAKVEDLIKVRNLKGDMIRLETITVRQKVQDSSSMRSASHCFIIDW